MEEFVIPLQRNITGMENAICSKITLDDVFIPIAVNIINLANEFLSCEIVCKSFIFKDIFWLDLISQASQKRFLITQKFIILEPSENIRL